MSTHPKVEAFWDAVPDDTTLEQIADGMDVTFEYEGKTYQINTKVLEHPRIHPIYRYYETLDAAVSNAKETT